MADVWRWPCRDAATDISRPEESTVIDTQGDTKGNASKKAAQRSELEAKKIKKQKGGAAANGGNAAANGGNAAPIGDPQAVSRNLAHLLDDLERLTKDQEAVTKALSQGAGKTQDVSDFNAIRNPEARYKQARELTEALKKVRPLYADYAAYRTTLEHACQAAEQGRALAKQALDAKPPGEWAQLVKLGRQLTAKVNQTQARLFSDGLPDGYAKQTTGKWDEYLIAQLKPFAQGKDAAENEALRSAVRKDAPTQADRQKAAADGKKLNDIKQKYEVRGLDNASVFFDAGRNGVPMSQPDRDAAMAANAALVEMGCNILNSGGEYKQVKELMEASGVREEAWPPQLVQAVQAWRKTQRALNEERVQALFKKPKKGFESPIERETLDAFSTIFKDSAEFAEALHEIAEQAEEAARAAEEAAAAAEAAGGAAEAATTATETVGRMAEAGQAAGEAASTAAEGGHAAAESTTEATRVITAAAWANGVGAGLDGILGLIQIVQGAKEFFEVVTEGEFPNKEGMLKLLGASLETLGGMARVAKDGMQMAKDFGGEALHAQMAKVIPGLGIAVAAIELAKSAKELGENLDSLNKASALKRDALASFARDDGDEAAVNVFANDKSGARTRVAKSSVEVGANATELAGAIATTAGGSHGAAAGAALAVVAGVVKVGSKVVFAGIDWSKAKTAMEKIREAQAGNYQAQVEVFEDSNFYAKMYLAIMVKEGNPMAQKYLINQGIEEGDLQGPTGLAILRDGMLDVAKQSNDLEADETLFGRVMGAGGKLVEGVRDLKAADVAEGAMKFVVAGGVLAPVTLTAVDFVRKTTTPAYDENSKRTPRTFNAEDVAAWPGTWADAKQVHIDNGLIDNATGLGAALAKAAEAYKAVPAEAAIGAGLDAQAMTAGAAAAVTAIRAIEAVVALSSSVQLQAYLPDAMMPTKCPHKPAHASLRALHLAANTVIIKLWERYDKLMPPGRNAWQPAPVTQIEVLNWTNFWKAGQAQVGFPEGDGGVAKAVAAAVKARVAFASEKDGKKRQAALAYIETLDDLNDAVLDARNIPEVNRCAPAGKAVDDFMLLLNKERRELDTQLSAADGKANDKGISVPKWGYKGKGASILAASEYLGEWKKVWEYAQDGGFAASSSDAGLTDALSQFQGPVNDWAKAKGEADAKDILKAVRAMEVGAGRVKKHAIEFGRKQRYAAAPLKAFVETLRKEVVKLTDDAVKATEADANQIKYDNTPSKQPLYLSSFDWRRVCDEAVSKGAVLESSTASKTLSDALKDLKDKRLAYEKDLKAKEKGKQMRKVAEAYEEALHMAASAVEMTRGLKRYGDNLRMAEYLDGIAARLKAYKKELEEAKHLDGSASLGATAFKPAELKVSNWHDNKKLAVENGVIPSKDTDVKEALEAFVKAADAGDAAKKKEKREALVSLLKASKASSRNAKWGGYIDAMVTAAEAR